EAVEMLKVCAPSPPVPTMSSRPAVSASGTLVENSRMTCAAAAISPMVSFFTRRPMVSAAIMTGDISPLMILRNRCSISSWKISRCSMQRSRASCSVIGMAATSADKEILQQRVAVFGQDRFRMELHAFDVELLMAHAHDLTVGGPRRHFQAVGQRGALDRQRVIADHRVRTRQVLEDADARVFDRRSLAVHDLLRAHYLAAERGADGLVAEAHAEDGQFPGEVLQYRDRDTCLGRR